MEQLNNKQITVAKLFIITGLFLLAVGMLFGVIGALQYLIPGMLKSSLSFEKIRPLHVSSVVFWIVFAATGSVLNYLPIHTGRKIYSPLISKVQFFIFLFSVIAILISYVFGMFGGREYWEFNPWFALPLVIAWSLFLFNVFKSINDFKSQPVYVWMWMTGAVFFLFTFLESYLWVFPYFRNNVINDMTIQWKSNGSMVGSWNMLIYGCSIFLMEKISGSSKYSHSAIAYVLYFTGFFNLLFNWGHHIYTLPTHDYIKNVSYVVSMTELFIFGRIIWLWKSTVSTARQYCHLVSYRFILAAEVWIFLTLFLAILMSIPAINVYTHGTHITVAHTMGATIGINSFLLLAFTSDVLLNTSVPAAFFNVTLNSTYRICNGSLFIFWISLIMAGIYKSRWLMSSNRISFSSMMIELRPFFILFFISGLMMMLSFTVIIYLLVKNQFSSFCKQVLSSINTKYKFR